MGVQGEFGFGRQVATVKVGQEGVAPLANPLDRPANAFCRPSDQCELRAAIVADPEIPADIAGNHAHPVLCNPECSGNVVALPDHTAPGASVDGELRCGLVVDPERGPQLHRHTGDTVDRCLQPHYMRGAPESRVGRLPLARFRIDA